MKPHPLIGLLVLEVKHHLLFNSLVMNDILESLMFVDRIDNSVPRVTVWHYN